VQTVEGLATPSATGHDPDRRPSATIALTVAAAGAAMIAVLGDLESVTWITVAFALVGLVPWLLESMGVRLGPMVFVLMTMLPASAVVLLDGNPGGVFPALIAVVWITLRRESRAAVAIGVGAAIGMTIGCAIVDPSEFSGAVYFLGGVGVAWLTGYLLYRQETLVAELRGASERERAHAVVEERTRIAREVHDVIAHSLTVTILHVTGARRILAHDPERAADALERAEAVGRESLDSIRQVVGLLRESDDRRTGSERSGDVPLPQLSDIPSLITQYREAGLRVDASLDLDGVAARGTTSLAAFRLVQEAMTNTLRHAPGVPVSLSIHPDEARSVIRIRVENPERDDTARLRDGHRRGLGLTGMAERVRSAGGSFQIGPTDSGTWLISAELPLDRTRDSS
jgi:signal transduction histidine kinase